MEYTGFIFRNFVKFLGEMFRNVATQLEIFHRDSITITSRGNELKDISKKYFCKKLATSPVNEIKRYFKPNFYKKTCGFSSYEH